MPEEDTVQLQETQSVDTTLAEPVSTVESETVRSDHLDKDIRAEVVAAVENGTDVDGKRIKNGFVDVLTNPDRDLQDISPNLRAMVLTYRQAKPEGAISDVDANKLIASMEVLHKQAGLENYKVEIEMPEGNSQEDKARAVRQKVVDDLAGFPGKATEVYMTDLYKARFDERVKVQELQEVTSVSTDLNRGEVRTRAYSLDKTKAKSDAVERQKYAELNDWDGVVLPGHTIEAPVETRTDFAKFEDLEPGEHERL